MTISWWFCLTCCVSLDISTAARVSSEQQRRASSRHEVDLDSGRLTDGLSKPYHYIETDPFVVWTRTLKQQLKNLDPDDSLVVLGNEAGDCDSIASSLVLAYMKGGVAFMQFSAAEIYARPETVWLLEKLGVNVSDLLYEDEPLEVPLANSKVILVDHNALKPGTLLNDRPRWKVKKENVIGILDHHAETKDTALGPNNPDRVLFDDKFACRSSASLVAFVGMKNWTTPLPPEEVCKGAPSDYSTPSDYPGFDECVANTKDEFSNLWNRSTVLDADKRPLSSAAAQLLRGCILKDSRSLTLAGGKMDTVAVDGLEVFMQHEEFAIMTNIRLDKSSWDKLDLHAILTSDAKPKTVNGYTVLLATIGAPFDAISPRDGLKEALEKAAVEFGADVVMLNFSVMKAKLVKGIDVEVVKKTVRAYYVINPKVGKPWEAPEFIKSSGKGIPLEWPELPEAKVYKNLQGRANHEWKTYLETLPPKA